MYKHFIGIDWADEHHDFAYLDKNNKFQTKRIDNSYSGFSALHSVLTELSKPEDIAIAIETKASLLIAFLIQKGYHVFHVNPMSLKRFKETFKTSGSKSDLIDAKALAEFIRIHYDKIKPIKLQDKNTEQLLEILKCYKSLGKIKTQLNNQIKACLKQYFPLFLKLFDTFNKTSIAFLKAFNTPEILLEISEKDFFAFFKSIGYSHPNRVPKLYNIIKTEKQYIIESGVKADIINALLNSLEGVMASIETLKEKMETLLQEHPKADMANSLPGAGLINASFLVAIFTMANSCHNYAAFCAYIGVAPIQCQSGKFDSIKCRKATNRFILHAFMQFAFNSIQFSKWAKEYYKNKAKEKGHIKALRALAYKWGKIIFSMSKSNRIYDENKHLQNIELRKMEKC